MELVAQIRTEIDNYRNGQVRITDSYYFSQHKLVKRIYNLANKIYPSGNIDSQGNLKYWYDVITPRINDETKNIDFDTKDISLYSEIGNDQTRTFLANCLLREWMRETKQGVSLNEDIEECTGWGNALWKKTKGGKVKLDFIDTYVINQKAKTVEDTPVIERHCLTQAQLREKRGTYDDDALSGVIETRSGKSYGDVNDDRVSNENDVPVYELFERNGEVCLRDLNDAREKMGLNVIRKETDAETYVLAKVVVSLCGGGKQGDESPVLYAEEIKDMKDVYKEYHRGRYNGRWFREGFYEMLADIQIRANELGNEIARALEFGGKQIFSSSDPMAYKNVLTDMLRGDIIQAKDLKRVDMTVPEIAHYISEWNLLMQNADRITGSNDVTSGEEMPAGTPFRLGAMLNANANKMYGFVREKLALSFKGIYQDWVLPDLLREFKSKDVVRITGDRDYLDEYHRIIVDNWYAANLVTFGPHAEAEAKLIKEAKLEQMRGSREEMVSLEKGYWDGFLARVDINITGESVGLDAEITSRNSLISLETDPGRRNYLLDQIWSRLGIDITKLPKAVPSGPVRPTAGGGGGGPGPAPQLSPQAV